MLACPEGAQPDTAPPRASAWSPHDRVVIAGLPPALALVPDGPRQLGHPDNPDLAAEWIEWREAIHRYRFERWWACDVPVHGVTGRELATRPPYPDEVDAARADEQFRCAQDALYLRNVWLATHESRGGYGRRTGWQPAVTYPFQARAFRWLDFWRVQVAHADRAPTTVWSKPRTVGATGCVLDYDLWAWLFLPDFKSILLSRKEDLVDGHASGTLFNRVLAHFGVQSGKHIRAPLALPDFLRPAGFDPARDKTRLHLPNPENGNEFIGESTTGTAGRSLRATVGRIDEGAFWDELAAAVSSMAETVASLLVTSSESDEVNEVFGELVDAARAANNGALLETDWYEHPLYTEEWERTRRAEAEAANRLDGHLREVWRRRGEGLSDRAYPEFERPDQQPGDFPYEPDAPVDGAIDPGRRDKGVIGIWSRGLGSERIRLLDAYGAHNKIPQYFASIFAGYLDPSFVYDDRGEELVLYVASLPPLRWVFGDPAGRATTTAPEDSWYAKMEIYWAEHLEAIRALRGEAWEPPGILVNWLNDARGHPGRREAVRQALISPGIDINDSVGGRETHIALKRSRWNNPNSSRVREQEAMPHDKYSHHRTMVEWAIVNSLAWDVTPSQTLPDIVVTAA